MADEFEMDDLSRLPPRPSMPQRPRSQMFEEPLHISHGADGGGSTDMMDPMLGGMDGNMGGFSGQDFGGPPMGGMDGMGNLMAEPPGMGMGMGGGGGGMGMGMGGGGAMMGGQMGGMAGGYGPAPSYPAGGDGGPVQKCVIFVSIACTLILLLIALGLSVYILIVCLDIDESLTNLQFKIKVPSIAPPPFRPNGK